MINSVKDIIMSISDYQGEINANTYLDKLELDSFMFIQLIVNLESAFNIEFSEDDLQEERFIKIGDLVERIEQLIKG